MKKKYSQKVRLEFVRADQAGVTLLLSILILAAITAISFSIATIVLVEVRSSGDLTRTEPAWYATETQAEEYLFQVRRGIAADTFPFTTRINNISLSSTVSAIADPIQRDVVRAGSVSIAATKNRYRIYNPDTSPGHNPLTDGSGYGQLQLTYLNTGTDGNIRIFLCQFDPNASYDCNDPTKPYDATSNAATWPAGGTSGITLSPGDTWPSANTTFIIDPTKQQELIVYSSGGSVSDRYIQIKSWDSSGSLKGLPFFQVTSVNIDATNSGILRSSKLTIPNARGGNSSNKYSLDLNGSGQTATIPHIGAYDVNRFTLESWVFPRAIQTTFWQAIVTKHDNSTWQKRNFGMFIIANTMKVRVSFQDSDCSTWRMVDSTGSMTQSSWNHVAMTYDGAELKLYLNGVLDATLPTVSGVCTVANSIYIGPAQPGGVELNGVVDDVRLWNYARSAAEISGSKSTQLTGTESGLVGYWKFNEGTGGSAGDSTSNSNSASLNGGASWSTSVPF